MSAWSHVVSGVPQGTISGPVLFLIFVNDIPEYCNTNVKLFADDTKLFNNNTDRTECQNLQYDLNALSAWSKTWHMNFNASKCAVLRIKPKTSFTYSLNNTPLKEENEQKDLGIIVSNDLKPRKHVYTGKHTVDPRKTLCHTVGQKQNQHASQLLDPYWSMDLLFGHHGLPKINRLCRGKK